MCGDELGIELVFIPEEFGGMGGATFDVYRVCEAMAAIDLGVATTVFATFLGTDPTTVGAAPDERKHWLGPVAEGACGSPTVRPNRRPAATWAR